MAHDESPLGRAVLARFTGEVAPHGGLNGDGQRDRAAFLESGRPSNAVRTMVAESWIRSAAAGVNPDTNLAPVLLAEDDLVEYRAAHPLARVFPLLYDVLGRTAMDCDCVMAVGDADGRLLWVSGPTPVLRRVGAINFVEGAAWDEHHAGTNAPGTALHLDAAVQIHATEHYNRLVQPWSCAAAPIHDPSTREILGIVDITGGEDVALPQSLGIVRAAARMAEAELARIAAVEAAARETTRATVASIRPLFPTPRSLLRLRGLGRSEFLAEIDGRVHRLSPRHSEILTVLVDHPTGMTAEQLEIEVYPADMRSSTMRAEMARLRGLLGPDVLRSRPYRLTVETDCDWQAVAAFVAAGRLRDGLRAYRGPLLPRSEAPGVVGRRQALEALLRAALLSCAQADLLVAWTQSPWGADDLPVWQREAALLPAGSPLRLAAIAETQRLDARFGTRPTR
jgi:hypothetical protein